MDAHAYDDVKYVKIIESIASVAAYQVEGVASLTNEAGAIFNINAYAKKGNNSVQAIIKDGKVIIDIYLNAYSNTKIPELSLKIQQKVYRK
jgi:uncharacterized alkaline shock family protein YloU